MNNSFSKIIAEQMKRATEIAKQSLEYDKTYQGVISKVLFDADTKRTDSNYCWYVVFYENSYTKIIIPDDIIHSVGDKVVVYVPNDNMSQRYAEVLTECATNTISYKTSTDNANEKVLNFKYSNAFKVESNKSYVFQTANKDVTINGKTANVPVLSKLTMPNGEEVTIEYD